MKIVAPLGGTDAGRSGLGTYVREILPRFARICAREGARLAVTGTAREHAAYAELGGLADRILLGEAVASPAASATWHALALGRFAARAGADVVLLPAANRRLCLRSPLPTVSVVHDLAMLTVRKKYDTLRTAYARWLVVEGLRRSTTLVAISSATARDVARFTGRADAGIPIVPHGVDLERFRPGRGPLPATRPYILYPARLEHPGKNHVALLHAFASTAARRTHDLVFCGDDWGGGPILDRVTRELGLRDRVRVLGRVGDAELVALYQGASAVAMVGLCEGFGLPALEALACGVPVVAADAGALPEVVGDVGIRVDPREPLAIAAGLDHAVSPGARRRAAVEGPAWARRWSWDRAAEALFATCIGAVASRRALPIAV